MLYARQRLLLSLLDDLQGNCAGTDFQKYLFLFTREYEAKPSFDFIPYRFGCFSFTSYADKRKLIDFGLLERNEDRWILTQAGEKAARDRPFLPALLADFHDRYGKVKGKELLRDIYMRYPFYAINSEIVDEVLTSKKERYLVESSRPVADEPGLLTIGYEGKSLEGYLNQLIGAGVTLLCDVRRNPLSRKYGFSKSILARICEGIGVRYEHLSELGIASKKRQTLFAQSDYDRLFADYKEHDLPRQSKALSQITDWITKGSQRVALTCFELHPNQCHRHCIAETLSSNSIKDMRPMHL